MVAVFFSGLRDRSPVLVSFCANKGTDARGGPRASLTAGAKRVVFRLQWENVFFPEPCEGCFDCCTSGQEKPWPTFFERRQNLGPHRGSSADHAELERPAPAVQVLNADALAFPWESLEGPWKIISNLPYNVGSPLMWDIVSRTPDLTRAVFMVQKEVAERLYAKPGTKDYGALSVWIQSYVRVEWGFVVGSIRLRRWIPPWSRSSPCLGNGIPRTRRPFPPY